MTQITYSGGLIVFQDTATGLSKQIGQNRLWVKFSEKGDTINFLQVDIPTDGYDGTPFWTCRASELTINGETYTIEELKNGEGLDGMFSSMSFNIEIVDELPEVGDPSTIYLIYDDETGSYTEYLWLAQEQVWEQLGSVAEVDLGNYYNKSQVDQLLAAKANTSSLSTVATSGSYNDLSDKPVIPTVPTNVSAFTNDAGYLTEHQSLANYYNKSQTDNLLNGKVSTGTLATVATSGSYNDLTNKPDLSTKQDVLVSGVNIKTINSQSLLGEGNINIEGGGGGTQVQSNWNETDTTSMAYIQNKPTNVSAFTNDAGYLTSHQSLADVFADVAYDSATKRINFYGKGDTQHTTALAYVDASDFVKDGMVEDVRIENGNLVIDFNTDSGITDISIPLTDIFDPSNYYTKSEVDTALAGKASTSSLSTVATTGSYNDLTNKPTIPAAQVNSDWNASSGVAQILNKPTIPDFDYYSEETTQNGKKGKIDTFENNVGAKVEVYGGDSTGSVNLNVQGESGTESSVNLSTGFFTADVKSGSFNTGNISLNPGFMYISFETNDYDSNGFRFGFDENGNMVIANSDGDDRVAMVSELSDYATTSAMNTALSGKQDTLVSGTNIKTINNQSILGSGNITIEGGSQITVDSALSSTSTNPVENRAIYAVVGDIEQALAILNGTTNA